ncbi:MAG: hypothetical protein ABSC05_02815 [Candidatus Solibacter sp.]|jgi:hypothetical protein
MSGELATTGTVTTNIEQVLLGGDLSKLNPQERLNYYNAVCTSLKLNPLTQPFSYIVLNGKLQLYAKKDCTEQLRKIHGVSITKVDPKQIGDLIVVVADAADRDGRTDSATGAVNVAGKKGDDLANLMMRCETKAKRRVTLSICGLGMLDETEVDTFRDQGVASEPRGNQWEEPQNRPGHPAPVEQTTITRDDGVVVQGQVDTAPSVISHSAEPDIRPRSQRNAQPTTQAPAEPVNASPFQHEAPQGEVQAEPSITEKQRRMLFAIQKSVGLSDDEVKAELERIGLTCHRDNIPKSRFQDVLDAIDSEFRFHQQKQ